MPNNANGYQTLVVDISRYQAPMDFKVLKSKGILGVFARATVGDYYTDPCLREFYDGAKGEGLFFGVYHVTAPADSYGRRISVSAQMGRFANAVQNLDCDFPYVMDNELKRGCTPSQITYTIRGCCDQATLIDIRSRLPMNYTRASWWNPNVLRSSTWVKYKLIVAHYNSYVDEPDLPLDYLAFTMWQWSADGNGLGAEYGSGGEDDIDLDRYRASVEEFYREFGLGTAPIPPEPPVEKAGIEMEVLVDDLRVRSAPSTSGTILTSLDKGTKIVATDVSSPVEGWVKHTLPDGRVGWSAYRHNSSDLMKTVQEAYYHGITTSNIICISNDCRGSIFDNFYLVSKVARGLRGS